MKRSIFFRNFVVTCCIFAVCFLVFGLTMFFMGRAFITNEKRENLYANAEEVRRYTEAVRLQGGLNSWELRMNLATISLCTGNHIFICDTDGEIVSSSDSSTVSPYVGLSVGETIIDQLETGGGYEGMTNVNGIYDGARYVVAEPIRSKGERVVGYVFVSYESAAFFNAWSGFVLVFVLIALGVLGFAVAFSYASSKRLTRPLHEMSEAANHFARGDYSARVGPYEQHDEIGMLTEAFNVMAESLQENEALRREFVANVSHELRTPMTTISGFADGILDGTIPAADERKYIETISTETKRLSRLVRSMLDVSRLREVGPQNMNKPFNLTEMVLQTVLNFEKRVDAKSLTMSLNMPEDELTVKGDMDALTRVVYNLMDNAVKFAKAGTEISVSVWKENGKAYTSVQNVGETIPPEELQRIFDRFHKADRSRSKDRDGVGLGLYMVREILAAHEQDIFVTSQNGVTVFTFTLALKDGDDLYIKKL